MIGNGDIGALLTQIHEAQKAPPDSQPSPGDPAASSMEMEDSQQGPGEVTKTEPESLGGTPMLVVLLALTDQVISDTEPSQTESVQVAMAVD